MIDVVEEGVERLDALLDPLRQPPPFRPGNDPGHYVEGDQPFGGLLLAIDGKCDARLAEDAFGVAHLFGKPGWILLLQPAIVSRIRLSEAGFFRQHLVERYQAHTPL